MFQRLCRFCDETLWRLGPAPTRWQALALKPLRFALLTARCCVRDGAMLHASALTYITMLAIVPVLTLGLTSLKAFGAGDLAERKLLGSIESFVGGLEAEAPQAGAEGTAAADQAVSALNDVCVAVFDQINSINFAQIGAVGAVALIFMVIGVLGKIENSFNAIWGVRKARPLWRKFTDYLSVIIIAPLLVLAATTLPILDGLTHLIPDLFGLRTFLEAIGILGSLVPLLLGTLLFAFLFGFLPNTKVALPSCFLGGFLTVLALALFFKVCFVLQVGIANYSALYGSLVALPVLLFWIYSSWQIVLVGAEICYVHQHRAELTLQSAFSHPAQRDTLTLALALALGAAHATEAGTAPLALRDFARALSLSERDVTRVAAILERNRILLPIADPTSTLPAGYVLARCATVLTVADVINACLDDAPGEDLLARTAPLAPLHPILVQIDRGLAAVLDERFAQPLADVLKRAHARPPAAP